LSSVLELGSVAPLTSALLMLSVGFLVLVRFSQNKMRETLYWGSALLFYGFSHIMEFAFSASLIVQDNLTFFIRQTFVTMMLVLFYAGCSLVLTKQRVFTALSTLLFFIIQEPLLFYIDFVIVNFTLSSTIHIIFFVIPFSIFFLAFFLTDYLSSRRVGSLAVAIAWLTYACIVPLYFLWRETPLLPIWFVLRSISLVPLFLGFVILAFAKIQKKTIA